MQTIIISNVDDALKQQLQDQADKHGHSLEEEASNILRSALVRAPETAPGNLAGAIRAIVEPLGGIELDILPRKAGREPPAFT